MAMSTLVKIGWSSYGNIVRIARVASYKENQEDSIVTVRIICIRANNLPSYNYNLYPVVNTIAAITELVNI